jgi:hypothetical protein
VEDRGLELDCVTPCGERELGKSDDPRDAKCGAVGAPEAPFDPDLGLVVEAWSRLPEVTRRAVLAMVEAAGRE